MQILVNKYSPKSFCRCDMLGAFVRYVQKLISVVSYYAADDHGHKLQSTVALRIDRSQYGELIHWLKFHLKGKDPPPALYALEMLLQHLEYLRGGRHYLYNSIYEITLLEDQL